jgi:cobyrinic acid a,c-diamide synthase
MHEGPGGLEIGYREATTLIDTLLTRRGEIVRGHEFHASSLDTPLLEEEAAYTFAGYNQVEGIARGNLLASYVHLSMSGFPLAARRFIEAAQRWQTSGSSSSFPEEERSK